MAVGSPIDTVPAESLQCLPLPALPVWTAGADGRLWVGWCPGCARLLHPRHESCPRCYSVVDSASVSGEATVVAYTVNHQRWVPALAEPYVVGVVALREEPSVRLVSNIVGVDPDSVVVGMAVAVEFRSIGDVWLPVFRPSGNAVAAEVLAPPEQSAPARPNDRFEQHVVLSGIGRSRCARRLEATELDLVLQSCRGAIDDAGLTSDEIDGLCAYPGSVDSTATVRSVGEALSITPDWCDGAHEVPGQTGTVITAMLAVAAGLCRHVLCWSSVSTHRRPGLYTDLERGRVAGESQWYLPFGAVSPAHWIGLAASQYLATYGASREALGWIAINARRHAALNPDALFREPLDMERYLAGRTITTPFGLYDCDVPCDGAYAVVVSSAETAPDLRGPAVRVDAVGTRINEAQSWVDGTLTHQPNLFGPAAHLWSRATVGPGDVDVATLYDGFTFNVLSWLEALGFCGLGEAGDFVAGGDRIGPGGELPINPHGGQLAAGRSNGYGHLLEAVVQLRNQGGARQVNGAEVALVSAGGGIPANCLLLTVDR